MADIRQLAKNNIAYRRKRPPLPPPHVKPPQLLPSQRQAVAQHQNALKPPPKLPPPKRGQQIRFKKPPPPLKKPAHVPIPASLPSKLKQDKQIELDSGKSEIIQDGTIPTVAPDTSPKRRPKLALTLDVGEDDESDIPLESVSNEDGSGGNSAKGKSRSKLLTISVDEDEAEAYPIHPTDDTGSPFLPPLQAGSRVNEDGQDSLRFGAFEVHEGGLVVGGQSSRQNFSMQTELLALSALGAGAGGAVHKAVHIPTMRIVAVKTIPVYDENKREQMVKEVKALYQNLAPIDDNGTAQPGKEIAPCPHIVAFFDAFIDREKGYLSMVEEYMNGGSLQDIIDTGGCSAEPVLAQISCRVLKGLEYIHKRRQIHRDIKPSNLLINNRGEAKISDFGIVRELDSTEAMASTFVGTWTYMSPERILGESYGSNSDIWSFGLSIMSVALGHYPLTTSGGYWGILHSVNEEPVPTLPNDQFSEEFSDFVSKCLHKDPNK